MTKAIDVVRAAIPDADLYLVNYLIWNRTAYPLESTTAKQLYQAAFTFIRAKRKGITLCEHCDNIAMLTSYVCEKCYSAIKGVVYENDCGSKTSSEKIRI